LRLCSGKFRRGMKLTQMGTGKILSVNSPILFFAREREIVDLIARGDSNKQIARELGIAETTVKIHV
ncbi:LuxR C-terminal-related transcriptional regulator, partial [Serratia marcescens]|uniref:LuxR C-terminal-related transcriptional regulator n=1 Tax=Serratia marcescens TaxID=615 RepID=UPI001EF98A5E